MDRQSEVTGRLDGNFGGDAFGPVSGLFSAKAETGKIVFCDDHGREIRRSPSIRLRSRENSTFTLFNVIIGSRFHWERKENQTFQGDLVFLLREDGTICAINEIPLETYLESVISSEMSAAAPMEFLKAHAILSRSWLLASFGREKKTEGVSPPAERVTGGEIIRWYEREDHDLFDVCADDHCQRYQGITKIISGEAMKAVRETCGKVITHQDEICDARYSKCCGGITEQFDTAWENRRVPYLTSIADAPGSCQPIVAEEEASAWILSSPETFCNTTDEHLLGKILPDFDRETRHFFRWKIEYPRKQLEEILREKSDIDFGTLQEIVPLRRGPSGRIFRLRIVGSKKTMIVGKELEIRRWLSRSHLYSSAFIVTTKSHPNGEVERFILNGAGWGHGVGLCQIGAAVMATRGFSAEEILKHYFTGVQLKNTY
jgi:SpoIID/LytB domain protein